MQTNTLVFFIRHNSLTHSDENISQMVHHLITLSNVAGKHKRQVKLHYDHSHGVRDYCHCVCCSADYIFVGSHFPAVVHVCSWTGIHIQTLSQNQLGFDEDHSWIHAIQCNHDGTTLHLATGSSDEVLKLSLQSYKVRWTFLSYIPHVAFLFIHSLSGEVSGGSVVKVSVSVI